MQIIKRREIVWGVITNKTMSKLLTSKTYETFREVFGYYGIRVVGKAIARLLQLI